MRRGLWLLCLCPQLTIGVLLLVAVNPRVEIPGGDAESVHVDDPFKSISSGW